MDSQACPAWMVPVAHPVLVRMEAATDLALALSSMGDEPGDSIDALLGSGLGAGAMLPGTGDPSSNGKSSGTQAGWIFLDPSKEPGKAAIKNPLVTGESPSGKTLSENHPLFAALFQEADPGQVAPTAEPVATMKPANSMPGVASANPEAASALTAGLEVPVASGALSFRIENEVEGAAAGPAVVPVDTEAFMNTLGSDVSGDSGQPGDAYQTYATLQKVDGSMIRDAKGIADAGPLGADAAKVINQVQEPLVHAIRKGLDHVQIRLKPEGLGELHIDIRIRENQGVSLKILAGTDAAKQVLEAGMPDLRGHLESRGIQLGQADVSHREGRDEQMPSRRDGDGRESGQRQQRRRSGSEFSEFLG